MTREQEVYDIEEQGLKQEHNIIYSIVKGSFDKYLMENAICQKEVDIFYIDKRLNKLSLNKLMVKNWSNDTKTENILSSQNFKDMIQKNGENGFFHLLLGRKGSGKSTLIVHFLGEIRNDNNVLSIYLNLRTKKTDNNFLNNLHDRLYDEIYDNIFQNESSFSKYITYPQFARQLNPIYENLTDNEIAREVLLNKKRIMTDLFSWLPKNNKIIYLFVDNVDDWSLDAVRKAIDFCTNIKSSFNIKVIIALRDYWTPKRLGLTDKNYTPLSLAIPDYIEIIKKRLTLSIPDDKNDIVAKIPLKKINGGGNIELTFTEIKNIYLQLIIEIYNNKTLQKMLFSLSNYNLREYIKIFFYFFHSVQLNNKNHYYNLLTEKVNLSSTIKYILEKPRNIQFHDFIEHNMAINSHCFDINNSWIFNIFYHQYEYEHGEEFRNTLMFLRIILNLSSKYSRDKSGMIKDLMFLGYPEDAINNAVNKLLSEELIQSVEGVDVNDVCLIFLSIKGKTYLTNVITEYSYYLYLADVTPMPDKYRVNVKNKYGDVPIGKGNLDEKINSVQKFIEFLKEEEKAEEKMIDVLENKKILKRYKRVNFFDEIMINHINPTIIALRKTKNIYSGKKKNTGDALIQ